MSTILRSDVPVYLRAGSFFESLDPHDEGVFVVPDRCFKIDTKVECVDDLECLLNSIRYWGVVDISVEAFQFLMRSDSNQYIGELVEKYPQFESYLRSAVEVREATTWQKITLAISKKFGVAAVQFLHQAGHILAAASAEAAASVGDLESLRYLHSVECSWNEQVIAVSIRRHDLEVLRFALENGCPLPSNVMSMAARTGSIELVKCLRDHNIPWEADTLTNAIISQNVECVRYLHGQGCAIGEQDSYSAAINPSAECLAFVHQNGAALGSAMVSASLFGTLPCIQYIYAQQGVWTEGVMCCSLMALGGHLDCLRFAHENGCPWSETTLKNAFRQQQWSCFWYALRHGCPYSDAIWCLVDLFSLSLTVYNTAKNPRDNMWYNTALVYIPLQRFISNVRTHGYVEVRGPNRDVWNVLLGCFDLLIFPASLIVLYEGFGIFKDWLY